MSIHTTKNRIILCVTIVVIGSVVAGLVYTASQIPPPTSYAWTVERVSPSGEVTDNWTIERQKKPILHFTWGGQTYIRPMSSQIYAPPGWLLRVRKKR